MPFLPLKLHKLIALGGGWERADLDLSLETCALSSVQDLFVNNSGMTARLVRHCTCEIDNIVDC